MVRWKVPANKVAGAHAHANAIRSVEEIRPLRAAINAGLADLQNMSGVGGELKKFGLELDAREASFVAHFHIRMVSYFGCHYSVLCRSPIFSVSTRWWQTEKRQTTTS